MKTQIPTVRSHFRWSLPAMLTALLLCVSAHAQVLSWVPLHTHSGTPAGTSDGAGSWNTTGTKSTLLTNWYNGSIDVPWSDGNSISVGGGSALGAEDAIALKAPVMVGNVTFNQMSSGGYNLSSGSITFVAGGGTNECDNTAGTSIFSKITINGSVGFTKTGAGTLLFSDAPVPTFTGGPLHVVAGTLQTSGSDWLYSAADLSVDSGATFDINGRNATVGALIGAGSIADTGNSTRTFTIGNSDNGEFDGSVGASGITLVKNGSGVEILGTGGSVSSATVIVTNGTLLDNNSISGLVNVSSTATFGGTGSVGGKVTYSSGAQAEFSTTGTMSISGALIANGNTVLLNLPTGLADGNYTLANYNATGSSGSFAVTPSILTGSFADAQAVVTVASGGGTVTLNVAPCTAAGVSQSPVNTTAFIGNTATFTVVATGSTPTYDWQVSVDNGSTFNDLGDGTGQGTPTYTTHTLSTGDNNNQYRCVIGVACDSTTQPSGAATLTVVDPSTYSFESVTSGNWNNPSTWNQSANGGATWSPATSTPFAGNAGILIQNGNTVTVTAPVTIDHTVIQSGGEVDVSGATLTITGSSTPDCDVSGILNVTPTAGSAVAESGTPDVVFENGGSFTLGLVGGAFPTATWAANSTATFAPTVGGGATNGTASMPTGLGQVFGNFAWNWPSQTASAIGIGTAGLANVQGNLDITTGTGSTSSFSFGPKPDNAGTSQTLVVGGTINVHQISGNFLLGAGGTEAGTYLVQVGQGIIVDSNGKLDMGNNAHGTGNVTVEFTGNSQFTLNGVNMGNVESAGYLVDAGHTVTMNSTLSVGRTLTVNGNLNFNGNEVAGITNTGALLINSTGTLTGNGTGQLTTGLGSVTYGGTLNINQASLTGLFSGQSILLFGPSGYSGSFASIIPATPPGFAAWDTSQLDISGSLVVSGSVIVSPTITSTVRSGSNLTISGTGAPVSDGFTVFGTGNLTTPRSSWTDETSNGGSGTSDGSGNFSVTINNATSSGAAQFYTIKFN